MGLREAVSRVINNEAQAAVVRHSTWQGDQYQQSSTFAQVARSGGGKLTIEAHGNYDAEHMEELGFSRTKLSGGQEVWSRDARCDVEGSIDAVASMMSYVSGTEELGSNDFGGVRLI